MFQLKNTFNNGSFSLHNRSTALNSSDTHLLKTLKRDTVQRKKAKGLSQLHDTIHKLNYSVIDVKNNVMSNGPQLKKQYVNKEKSITERYNIRRQILEHERLDSQEKANAKNENIEKSDKDYLKDPSFLRQIHKVGPNYLSPKFVNMILKDHKVKLFSNLKVPNRTEMKQKMNMSDIFNIKGMKSLEIERKNSNENPNNVNKPDNNFNSSQTGDFFKNPELDKRKYVHESDIFFVKNNKVSLAKSYDAPSNANLNNKTMINFKRTFGANTESESSWYPRDTKATLMNHPSIRFNILNPAIKGIGKTKEEIYAIDKDSCCNKKKSIAEYVDLFRNFCPNKNEKFRSSFDKNNKEFFSRADVCTQYDNLFSRYYPLILHPFNKNK